MEEKTLPRKGSIMYSVIKGGESYKKTIKKFKFFNKWFVVPLYRANILPLFGAGFFFALLKTKGRKSGRIYYTPVEYRRKGDVLFLFASRGTKTDWLRNIIANPEFFEIKIGFKRFKKPDKIEVVKSREEKLEIIKWYVKKFPKAAKELFGWNPKKDTPTDEVLSPVSDFIEILKLKL